MVDKSIEFKLGARGLRSIVEAIMIDAMFELPSTDCKELHITRAYAEEKMKKANDLFCCEEYRAGYIEACREIFLYADFLSINKPKKL